MTDRTEAQALILAAGRDRAIDLGVDGAGLVPVIGPELVAVGARWAVGLAVLGRRASRPWPSDRWTFDPDAEALVARARLEADERAIDASVWRQELARLRQDQPARWAAVVRAVGRVTTWWWWLGRQREAAGLLGLGWPSDMASPPSSLWCWPWSPSPRVPVVYPSTWDALLEPDRCGHGARWVRGVPHVISVADREPKTPADLPELPEPGHGRRTVVVRDDDGGADVVTLVPPGVRRGGGRGLLVRDESGEPMRAPGDARSARERAGREQFGIGEDVGL